MYTFLMCLQHNTIHNSPFSLIVNEFQIQYYIIIKMHESVNVHIKHTTKHQKEKNVMLQLDQFQRTHFIEQV